MSFWPSPTTTLIRLTTTNADRPLFLRASPSHHSLTLFRLRNLIYKKTASLIQRMPFVQRNYEFKEILYSQNFQPFAQHRNGQNIISIQSPIDDRPGREGEPLCVQLVMIMATGNNQNGVEEIWWLSWRSFVPRSPPTTKPRVINTILISRRAAALFVHRARVDSIYSCHPSQVSAFVQTIYNRVDAGNFSFMNGAISSLIMLIARTPALASTIYIARMPHGP